MEVTVATYTKTLHYILRVVDKQWIVDQKEVLPANFNTWSSLRDRIYRLVENNVCKGDVSEDYVYVRKVVDGHDQPVDERLSAQIAPWSNERSITGETIVDKPPYRRNVIAVGSVDGIDSAFVLANTNKDVYIDVICGSPGKGMMTAFLDYVGDRNTRLSSLMSVLNYYPKFGFQFGKCNQYPEVNAYVKTLPENAFSNPRKLGQNALETIHMFRSRGLVNPSAPECDTYSDKRFALNDCYTNGVQMERCARPVPTRLFPSPHKTRKRYNLRYEAVAKRTRSRKTPKSWF